MAKKVVSVAALSVLERELRKQAKGHERIGGEAGTAAAGALRQALELLKRVKACAEPWRARVVWVFSTDDDSGANVSVHVSHEAAEAAARVWARERWDDEAFGPLEDLDIDAALKQLSEGGMYGRIERCVPLSLFESAKAGGHVLSVDGGVRS